MFCQQKRLANKPWNKARMLLNHVHAIFQHHLYAHVDKYDKENMVLYQAKCNREEYDYIRNNYKTNAALKAATDLTMNNIRMEKRWGQYSFG